MIISVMRENNFFNKAIKYLSSALPNNKSER